MRTVIITLFSIIITMESFSQSTPINREPVAAGRFYSADKETLTRDISKLFASCTKSSVSGSVRAIISPHAGYVFSGKTAAAAYSATQKNSDYKNIFIIGSSHVMAFEGASVYNTGDFTTPLGTATVNRRIANKLKEENKVFDFPVTAHIQEHSIEVQIPLIQHYYNHIPEIVPIIIGTNNTTVIRRIAEALKPWFTHDNLFVISSDFSHYPSFEDAVETDNNTAEALISVDPAIFLNTIKKNASGKVPGLVTRMCGWTSGLVLLDLIDGDKNLELKRIDYSNSGDSPYGGKNEVVGYHAIAVTEKNSDKKSELGLSNNFSITDKEKEVLFSIAKNSIRSKLYGNNKGAYSEQNIPKKLKEPLGAFVTLKLHGSLRGCIGRFVSSEPLYEVVKTSALSSAFEDPRFSPLTKEEFNLVEMEITVLGPMTKIDKINEIVLGRHGIYIKKDFRSGTMLPQVATENGWSVEEFLGYTSRDKAGLGWDGWKNADIFIYEGIVLEEKAK